MCVCTYKYIYIYIYIYIDDIILYARGQVTWEEMRARRNKNDGFDEVLGGLITGGNWGKRL